ncbi:hypothetical protein HN51_028411 [Arachis hypogaea]
MLLLILAVSYFSFTANCEYYPVYYFFVNNLDIKAPNSDKVFVHIHLSTTKTWLKPGAGYIKGNNSNGEYERQTGLVYWGNKCLLFDEYDPNKDIPFQYMYLTVQSAGVYKSYRENGPMTLVKPWPSVNCFIPPHRLVPTP